MDAMTAAELREMFGLSASTWEQISSHSDMVAPMNPRHTGGVATWDGQAFARWLARTHPGLADEVPALLRPAATDEFDYIGGRYSTPEESGHGPEHFAALWKTSAGVVAVIYPLSNFSAPSGALEYYEEATTVVVVRHDYNLYGPVLMAVDRDRPDFSYEPGWSETAAHIGTQVPWWPSELRRREHLTAWRPGDAPAPVEVVTWPSWEPLYELARTEPEGSPVRGACFTIGHEMRTRAAESAEDEVAHVLDGRTAYKSRSVSAEARAERAAMVLPAVPDTADPGLSESVPSDVVALGLADMCSRTDEQAVECLEHVSMWSGEDLPFGGSFRITRSHVSRTGAEWINRLRPVRPTAVHQLWVEDGDPIVGTFIDPVTGSPVVAFKGRYRHQADREISYFGRAPKQLPTGSVLKEVILDDPVWVRTTDGVLYPAPCMDAPGLSWGYSGSGPTTLAECVGRLLDDGASHAVTYDTAHNYEPALEAFFEGKHKSGTRISRRKLERIRTSSRARTSLP
ncbi:hypothetical protein [Streptomyces luteogriseus]|uniref:hypothetical protein n=1 Tax=Streptomyces luteogriseus TaxID=68233 RepID=UPI00381EA21E